jgi:hypothetical protein
MIEDPIKAVPTDTVKSLMKIKFKNQSGSISTMATVQEISGVCEAVSNAATKNETSLIRADKVRDKRLEPGGEHLGQAFDGSVL